MCMNETHLNPNIECFIVDAFLTFFVSRSEAISARNKTKSKEKRMQIHMFAPSPLLLSTKFSWLSTIRTHMIKIQPLDCFNIAALAPT